MFKLGVHQSLWVLSYRYSSVLVLPRGDASLTSLHGAHHALLLAIHDIVQVAAVLARGSFIDERVLSVLLVEVLDVHVHHTWLAFALLGGWNLCWIRDGSKTYELGWRLVVLAVLSAELTALLEVDLRLSWLGTHWAALFCTSCVLLNVH